MPRPPAYQARRPVHAGASRALAAAPSHLSLWYTGRPPRPPPGAEGRGGGVDGRGYRQGRSTAQAGEGGRGVERDCSQFVLAPWDLPGPLSTHRPRGEDTRGRRARAGAFAQPGQGGCRAAVSCRKNRVLERSRAGAPGGGAAGTKKTREGCARAARAHPGMRAVRRARRFPLKGISKSWTRRLRIKESSHQHRSAVGWVGSSRCGGARQAARRPGHSRPGRARGCSCGGHAHR